MEVVYEERHGVFRRSLLLIVLMAASGWAGLARAETPVLPRTMVYTPGQPVPPGYHVERRIRYGLAISGSILFALTYVPTAAAAWYDTGERTPLYAVPILGPLLVIPAKTKNDCVERDHSPCLDFGAYITAFFVTDAVVQAVGAIMAVRGFVGREMLIRNETVQAGLVPGRVGLTGYGTWLIVQF